MLCPGTIKKYHHKRGNMTHGSKSHRQHGSIGAATTPARVLPGLKMAGQMGNVRATVKGQTVGGGGAWGMGHGAARAFTGAATKMCGGLCGTKQRRRTGPGRS